MATISYQAATCGSDGDGAPVVDRLTLDVAAGELVALIGPAGSGKEAALRMAAGLEQVTAGRILINGEDVTERDPFDRELALVSGDETLYPQMSVAENLEFSLKVRGYSRAQRRARIAETASLLGFTQATLTAKPASLALADRRLAALGRAVAKGSDVLLLHEPTTGLSGAPRAAALARLAELQRSLGMTTILVTDDIDAALALGDRVAVMDAGRLVALDTARNLYEKPANTFVAGAIGWPAINLRTVRVSAYGAMLDADTFLPIPAHSLGAAQLENLASLIVGYRPEASRPSGAAAPWAIGLNVGLVEPLGAQARVHGRLDSDTDSDRPWVLTCESRLAPRIGERLHFTVDERAAHLFDPDTGLRLN
jgi:multiple sugar transport system ATP-binding protein